MGWPWNRSMRVSTAIIIGIGIIPLGWGAFSWMYLVIMKPPSWDIGIPWTALGLVDFLAHTVEHGELRDLLVRY